ncbi:MAG: tetratricopeptide repeat protein [Deltaproteobacteria bacterium]|uniref:Tetratricopeptide repeat protein n=1 Tax=Candidatus Zymogenus saltonus TaxID=2844893 RepID=A0A9D8PNL2_9DELT|nr:tetratricopeptide repeat protein [Candidatus Zymogenus saltonus]
MKLKRKRELIAAVKISAAVLATALAFTFLLGTSCGVPDEPKTAEGWYKKGKAYSDDDIYGKAIECLDKAIAVDPKHERSYSLRGYCYYSMAQYKEALADFEMALELGNEVADESYYYMGWTYYDMGNYEEAIICFTKVIKMHPNRARFYYDRGCAYKMLALLDEAEDDFRKACALGDSSGCEVAADIVKDRTESEKYEKNE